MEKNIDAGETRAHPILRTGDYYISIYILSICSAFQYQLI